jgi:hypothetical protein
VAQNKSDEPRQARAEITVQIRYRDIEKIFSGSLEVVWLSLNRFFEEFLPSFELAKKLMWFAIKSIVAGLIIAGIANATGLLDDNSVKNYIVH